MAEVEENNEEKEAKVIEMDMTRLPVMKKYCKTCPFKPDDRGVYRDVSLANTVIQRTLFKAHQICHGTEGKNRKPIYRCKGSYEYNEEIYKRIGLNELKSKR